MKNQYIASFVLSFFCSSSLCSAFMPSLPIESQRSGTKEQPFIASILLAKRKRRRKKASPDAVSNVVNTSNELPDFDLDDGEEKSSEPTKTSMTDLSPDEITPAMMGSSNKAVGSVNDLISDRSLEAKFEFEEGDSSIPDFTELAQASSGGIPEPAPMGKKKARREARRAAAVAAKAEEEEESILSNIPFIKNEKGEVSGVKVRHKDTMYRFVVLTTLTSLNYQDTGSRGLAWNHLVGIVGGLPQFSVF